MQFADSGRITGLVLFILEQAIESLWKRETIIVPFWKYIGVDVDGIAEQIQVMLDCEAPKIYQKVTNI